MEKLHRLSGREKIMIGAARLIDADGCGDDEEKESLAGSAPSSLLNLLATAGTFCSPAVSEQWEAAHQYNMGGKSTLGMANAFFTLFNTGFTWLQSLALVRYGHLETCVIASHIGSL